MVSPNNETKNENKHPNKKMNALTWLGHIQLHGANRLANRESCWFWIPSMMLLLSLGSTLLYLMIIRYFSNPTLMLEIDSVQSLTAFPSVIIYPGVTFRLYKQNQFLSNIEYPKDLNESYIREVLPQLAVFFSPDVPYNIKDLENLESLLEYNNMDVETAGRLLTENCEDILVRCQWQNTIIECSELFRLELARDGFCCVFHGRSLRGEMRANAHITRRKTYLYTSKVGFTSGLMVAINQTQKPLNIDLSYKWIALQAAQRFVDPTLNGTALSPGTEQWAAFATQSIYITNTARNLGAFLRRCALSEEKLKYFPTYKRNYCILECEIDRTIKRCGCVRVTHPRPRGVAYCNAKRLQCALRSAESAETCDCPHTCDVDRAVTTMSSFILDSTVPSIEKFYKGLNFLNLTIVRVFMEKRKRRSKERGSFYSFIDLFSQIGGMFNLFFGCSVLTMLALLKFFWKIATSLCTRPTTEQKPQNEDEDSDLNNSA